MKRSLIFVEIFVAVCLTVISVRGVPLNSASTRQPTKDIDPYNYFEDLIKESIGMSVKELLQLAQNTFSAVNTVTDDGVKELDKVMNQVNSEIKAELNKIRNNTISKIAENIGHLLTDLGSVLPILSVPADGDKMEHHKGPIGEFSAADIIWTYLGISLEDLVILIRNSFQRSYDLLTSTMADLEKVAQIAPPEISTALRRISEYNLGSGKRTVEPVLHQFDKLVTKSQPKS